MASRRQLVLNGKAILVRLDREVWDALEEIERREHLTLEEILAFAQGWHPGGTVAASARDFALSYFRENARAA